jgi:hypothetical protein
MAMSSNKHDREHDKFVETTGGDTAVRVVLQDVSASGVEYTEGDVDTSITGRAILWEDTGDTLKTVSAATPLPVNVVSGSTSGTEYTEGDVDTTITGTAMMAEYVSTSTLRPVNTKQLSTQVTSSDWGIVTNSVIHGLSSAGGGSFVDVKVTPSGALNVAATQDTSPWVVSGTVTANQGGTWNINNISGTVSLPTGAATETTLATLSLSQGSSTSGQKGPLALAAVTTAAPSYTTGQTNALSLTTAGALRTDSSATTQPVSGTVAFSNTTIDVTNTGTFAVQAAQSGTWNINNISGTISLPTGAATSANQTTANASLASIDTKLTAPLQVQTIAGSAGSMQIKTLVYAAKSVTTSATLMNKTGSNLSNRIILTLQPTNGTIYVGSDASVTTSTGTPVETGAFFPIYANATCNIYAIASGTVDVRIMEGSDQ